MIKVQRVRIKYQRPKFKRQGSGIKVQGVKSRIRDQRAKEGPCPHTHCTPPASCFREGLRGRDTSRSATGGSAHGAPSVPTARSWSWGIAGWRPGSWTRTSMASLAMPRPIRTPRASMRRVSRSRAAAPPRGFHDLHRLRGAHRRPVRGNRGCRRRPWGRLLRCAHPGIYLEGPFFTERYRAQNPAYLKAPSYEDFSLWQEHARGLIVKSALAAEHDEAPAYIARLAAEGVVTALGHSDASFEEALPRSTRAPRSSCTPTTA